MKTFEMRLSFRGRDEQTVESTVGVEASSLPGAVAKATRQFVKGLDRKQRFDMNKNGLEIRAKASAAAGGAEEPATKPAAEAAAGD